MFIGTRLKNNAFERENSDYSESNTVKTRKYKLKTTKELRKYTVDGSSNSNEDSDNEEFGKVDKFGLRVQLSQKKLEYALRKL